MTSCFSALTLEISAFAYFERPLLTSRLLSFRSLKRSATPHVVYKGFTSSFTFSFSCTHAHLSQLTVPAVVELLIAGLLESFCTFCCAVSLLFMKRSCLPSSSRY